jgi:hypothetical protein
MGRRAATLDLIAWIAAAVAAACAAIHLLGFRPLTVDEIEYFRATDWVAHGLVPYRDFFEHHLPLQWYLFAPAAWIVRSPGAAAIVSMRLFQLPLWVITFVALARWIRRDGHSPAVAVAALLASMLFVMPAIEYRVDTVSVCAMVLALAAAERHPFAGGTLASLAVLANLRFAPVAAVALIVCAVVDLDARRWRMPGLRRSLLTIIGAALPCAAYGSYLWVTGSWAPFYSEIVAGNVAMDRLASGHAASTLPMLANALIGGLDIGTVLLAAGAIVVVCTSDWRHPGRAQIAAAVAAANLLFVLFMSVQYFYHFELTLVLCTFLVAHLRHRAVGWIVLASALLAVVFTARGSRSAIRVQDAIMREANAAASPAESVLDGSGFAIRRRPAYRYWFLPLGVRLRAAAGEIDPYRPAMLMSDPPGAVVIDLRLAGWLDQWPELRRAVIRHYVPRWRNVWVPGGSGVIGPGGTVSIDVIRDGAYELIARPQLVGHPWFHNPVGTAFVGETLTVDAAAVPPAALTTNAGSPSRPLVLTRGTRLEITSHEREMIGFFLVPATAPRIFERPDGGGPLVDPLFTLR